MSFLATPITMRPNRVNVDYSYIFALSFAHVPMDSIFIFHFFLLEDDIRHALETIRNKTSNMIMHIFSVLPQASIFGLISGVIV